VSVVLAELIPVFAEQPRGFLSRYYKSGNLSTDRQVLPVLQEIAYMMGS
jgi:hypothetical protein